MKNEILKETSKRFFFSAALVSALCIASPQDAYAGVNGVQAVMQAGTVKGTVVDAAGIPVIGANVMVKGTTNGTITDIDGNFTLSNAKGTLVVSFIGYQTQEINVKGNETSLQIVLREDAEVLDEVVVVGYGTMKKESLTGSVAVVKGDILKNKGTVSNPLQALQGQVPGVRITRSSGIPGEEGWNISVRGAVSKNSTSPLVIIDGVEGELTHLNPADIESISFLKDASAAIYGSKAAGGVVLVTTKTAERGRSKIEYNGSFTLKTVGMQPRLMSLDEWADGVIAARTNDGKDENDQWIRYARLAKENKGGYISVLDGPNPIPNFGDVDEYVFHDVSWTDELWGNAPSTQHDLSISGGSDKFSYRVSLGYLSDKSNLQWGNNSNDRFTLRSNMKAKVMKRFTIESIISASRQNQVSPTMLGYGLSVNVPQPGLPLSTMDGKPYAWGGQKTPNWQLELGGDNKLVVSVVSINEIFKYNITEGFDMNVTLGYKSSNASRDEKFQSITWYNYEGNEQVKRASSQDPIPENSSYTKTDQRTDDYTASGYLNYAKTFWNKYNLNVMIGAQYTRTDFNCHGTSAKNIQSSLNVINGEGEIKISKAEKWSEAIMSYFSRINYDYSQKYLLEFNARYDGSSKFQPKNRWAFFYGVSGGWRITEEKFMAGVKEYIDDIKLKVSYGQVGNQAGISRYDGIQLYNYSSSGGAYIGNGKLSYISADGTLVSTERQWERIENYNIGIDFQALNNRLSGSFDLFLKKNNNMLVSRLYPGLLGGNAPQMNEGKFEGKGYEGNITWRDKIGKVSYNIGGTLTFMRNELKSGGNDVIIAGYNQFVNGYPLNSIFGYRYAGKIQNEEQREKYLDAYLVGNALEMPSDLRLGDNMYEDVNKDGRLDTEDLVYLGTDDPELSFSFNAGLEWKSFDFSMTFQGVGNRTIYRESDAWKVPFRAIFLNTTNQSIGNVWSSETPNARYPTYSNNSIYNNYNYIASSWSSENGAYLRLKNIVLGYTLPKSLLAKAKNYISNIRIYVAGTDLWETTKSNDGWDPEASRKLEGKTRYPFNRTYTVGLNVTF